MKRHILVFMFRWFIPLAFVFICIFLPDFSNQAKKGIIISPPLIERILFSVFLSYPYLSAAEILSKTAELQKQDYEQFFIKGGNKYILGRIIAAFTIIILSFAVMLFTLQTFFSFPSYIKWFVTIIFTVSVAMLRWNIDDYMIIKD